MGCEIRAGESSPTGDRVRIWGHERPIGAAMCGSGGILSCTSALFRRRSRSNDALGSASFREVTPKNPYVSVCNQWGAPPSHIGLDCRQCEHAALAALSTSC